MADFTCIDAHLESKLFLNTPTGRIILLGILKKQDKFIERINEAVIITARPAWKQFAVDCSHEHTCICFWVMISGNDQVILYVELSKHSTDELWGLRNVSILRGNTKCGSPFMLKHKPSTVFLRAVQISQKAKQTRRDLTEWEIKRSVCLLRKLYRQINGILTRYRVIFRMKCATLRELVRPY